MTYPQITWRTKFKTYVTRQSSCGKLQEAHHLRRNLSKHNLSGGGCSPSCPGLGVVPYPVLNGGLLPLCPEWVVPHPVVAGVPPPFPTWAWGILSRKDMGPVEVLWDGDGVPLPSRKNMGPVEVLWDGDGYPPGSKQTDKHYIPYRSDAGGNDWLPNWAVYPLDISDGKFTISYYHLAKLPVLSVQILYACNWTYECGRGLFLSKLILLSLIQLC